jgi:hypothetical protein
MNGPDVTGVSGCRLRQSLAGAYKWTYTLTREGFRVAQASGALRAAGWPA